MVEPTNIAQSELEFTGERFIPGKSDPLLALEHYHRYLVASQVVHGKRVLDVACGEGYGTAFLSLSAEAVLGVDKDEATITAARKRYASFTKAEFRQGECTKLDVKGSLFDAVVSFETIEHLNSAEQEKFLGAVSSALIAGGIFIVSTPNCEEYRDNRIDDNQFHKNELTIDAFDKLLKRFFPEVRLFFQRATTVSAIWNPHNEANLQPQFHMRRGLFEKDKSLPPPVYVLAICSRNAIPEKLIKDIESFYLDANELSRTKELLSSLTTLQNEFNERTRWAQGLDAEIGRLRGIIANLQQEFDERTAWAKSLDGENAQLHSMRLADQQKLTELRILQALLEDRLARITLSPIYRLLAFIGLLPKYKSIEPQQKE